MRRSSLRSLIALAAILLCTAAQAQPFRAYLASYGSDAGPCSVVEPCRLLPAALTVVANNGEIWMLDSANYNTASVAVTKSVTILAVPGAVGSVVALGGPALSIPTFGVNVTLRNLVIVPFPAGSATDGISMSGSSGSLTVENCVISNVPQAGILVTAGSEVKVTNTVIRGTADGVKLSGGAKANISGTTISNLSAQGVYVQATTAGTTTIVEVADSVITQAFIGVGVEQSGTAVGRASVNNTTLTQNSLGVSVTALGGVTLGVLALGHSTLTHNTNIAMYNSGGTLRSLGNNFLSDNNTDSNGTITALAPK